mmetsp:Transcript_7671/g.24149  ORF Transcript_7671/g.24149 Transcript_7671/m.24149 type:complete len:583 (+) Transcript_7671:326-2074(+)
MPMANDKGTDEEPEDPDFIKGAAHVQLAGALAADAGGARWTGVWEYAPRAGVAAAGELPFCYARTRPEASHDRTVQPFPPVKSKPKPRRTFPPTPAAAAAIAANAALAADAARAVASALEAEQARGPPRRPWEGFYEGHFALRRHGREAPVPETFVLWAAERTVWDSTESGGPFFDCASSSSPPPPRAVVAARGVGRNCYGKFFLRGAVFADGRLRAERSYAAPPKRKTGSKKPCSKKIMVPAPPSLPRASTRERKSTTVFDNSARPRRRDDSDDDDDETREKKRRRREKDALRRAAQRAGRAYDPGDLDESDDEPPPPAVEWREPFYDEADDEVYEGEVCERSGYRHGLGVCFSRQDERIYEGQWRQGREHGRGVLMASDGDVLYDGEFAEGRIQGRGTAYIGDDATYCGDFRDGIRHGKGEYRGPGGVYDGDWKGAERHGRGAFESGDGEWKYEGEWHRDKRHGKGRLEERDGTVYDGEWLEDVFHGRGESIMPDGARYEGGWRDGRREGRGSLHWPNGASYEGRFRDNEMEGQGSLEVRRPVPLREDDGETVRGWLLPIQLKADLARVHRCAGFDADGL